MGLQAIRLQAKADLKLVLEGGHGAAGNIDVC